MDSDNVIRVGPFEINTTARRAYHKGTIIPLTGKEYAILELLASRLGETITKEMFLNHLYRDMDEPELKIIDVFLCKIRKKLVMASGDNHYIETVWGRGYVMRAPVDDTIAV